MRDYPYGYCGMPCALCSRYHTNGKSRCPGCSCDGYYTDVCRVHHCCRDKQLEHCGACEVFPCARLGKMGDFRALNTNHVKERSCSVVAAEGFAVWYAEYAQRAELLEVAMVRYNDGRMKRYLCELFIRNDAELLREIMEQAEALEGSVKERGRGFRAIAESVLWGEA